MNAIVARKRRAKWRPQQPKVNFAQKGNDMITRLKLNVGPGQWMSFVSKTDLGKIERDLRNGVPIEGVGGLFGDIWKGVKGAVKAVGKATGLNKVIKVASKVIDNDIVKSVVPGASLVAGGLKVARGLLSAKVAKKKGKKRTAKKALRLAKRAAKKHRLDKREIRKARKTADTVYRLILRKE